MVRWFRRGVRCASRGVVVAALALFAAAPLLVLTLVSIALVPVGVGLVALPVVTRWVRALTGLQRTVAARWSDVAAPEPYRPRPASARGLRGSWRRTRWVLTDPATWRDLAWLLLEVPLGLVLGLLPAGLIVYGLEGAVAPSLLLRQLGGYGYGVLWPIRDRVDALLAIPQGVVIFLVGLAVAPLLLRTHAKVARWLLAPTRAADLARLSRQVRHLSDTRADTVDASAAELRRIERDLHDGAQARLVSLSMTIGLAQELMSRDPAAARRLLSEAREASGQALVELRALVRGIHPPVLAERGLAGAVRALALAVPLPVDVEVDLPGRLQAPVESAAYFAVAEALGNVARHSGARQAGVRLGHAGDTLTMTVWDDGAGGADPAAGTGLRGIARRLAAFDGTLSVKSPRGGPSVVAMELPCVWSSPRTSPSSGTV